jgi:hypothetical protein
LAAVPGYAQVMKGDRLLPPLHFDRPYTGGMLVIRRGNDPEQMKILCPMQPPFGYPRLACSYSRPGACVIILASDEMIRAVGIDPDVALRHEHGHCNGWGNDHKGAR